MRIWRVLIGISQTLNAAFGGNEDQTFSGRTALEAEKGARLAIIREAAIDLLFAVVVGHRHHCAASIERDET